MPRRLASAARDCRARIAGRMSIVLVALLAAGSALGQSPPVHYWHHGIMPPGAIGSRQLLRGGPLPGYFQSVEVKAPPGTLVSLAVANQFKPAETAPVRVGMLIGQVYRLRISNIPQQPGLEVFPTIEIIDRIYAPPNEQTRFAIPIDLSQEDLLLAIAGKFVTRVIYLENPLAALPVGLGDKPQTYFEVPPGENPLAAADALGRPVAILRMGARLPDRNDLLDEKFYFGSPALVEYPPRVKTIAPPPPRRPAEAESASVSQIRNTKSEIRKKFE